MNETSEKYLFEISKEIIKIAKSRGIKIKLFGGLAYWVACPQNREIYETLNRNIKDIDFVSNSKFRIRIHKLLVEYFNFDFDITLETIPIGNRTLYYDKILSKICELNYDFLDYSHKIDIRKSLDDDNIYTISLNDLLLSKLQIHQINSKDLVDIIVLLLEYDFGTEKNKQISLDKITNMCSKNWGLEHTIRKNCQTLYIYLKNNFQNDKIKREIISSKILEIIHKLDITPKTIKWKTRSHFKEKLRWYNIVE